AASAARAVTTIAVDSVAATTAAASAARAAGSVAATTAAASAARAAGSVAATTAADSAAASAVTTIAADSVAATTIGTAASTIARAVASGRGPAARRRAASTLAERSPEEEPAERLHVARTDLVEDRRHGLPRRRKEREGAARRQPAPALGFEDEVEVRLAEGGARGRHVDDAIAIDAELGVAAPDHHALARHEVLGSPPLATRADAAVPDEGRAHRGHERERAAHGEDEEPPRGGEGGEAHRLELHQEQHDVHAVEHARRERHHAEQRRRHLAPAEEEPLRMPSPLHDLVRREPLDEVGVAIGGARRHRRAPADGERHVGILDGLEHEALGATQRPDGHRDDELEIAHVRDLRMPDDAREGHRPAVDGVHAPASAHDHAPIGDDVLAAVREEAVHRHEPAREDREEHREREGLGAPGLAERDEDEREEEGDVRRHEEEEEREPQRSLGAGAGPRGTRPPHLLRGKQSKGA